MTAHVGKVGKISYKILAFKGQSKEKNMDNVVQLSKTPDRLDIMYSSVHCNTRGSR